VSRCTPSRRRVPAALLLALFALLAPGPAPARPKPPLTLDAAAPLFDGPAQRAFQEERYGEAAAGFEAFLAKAPGDRAAAAALLAGLAHARGGQHKAAAARLVGLHRKLSVLGPYAQVAAAESLIELKRPREALAELRGLAADTPLKARAQRAEARALGLLARPQDALRALAPQLAQARPTQAVLELALELETARGRKAESRRLRRRLWAEHPGSRQGKAPKRPRDEERLQRGQAFYKAHRHDAALAELAPLRGGGPLRCSALFLRGHTLFKARRYGDAVKELAEYRRAKCPAKADPNEAARALYYAGRAAARSGQPGEARRLFELLAKAHPASNLADDALLLSAEVAQDQAAGAEAERLLRDLARRFPKGDMVEEAWWRRIWARYLEGRREEALAVLDEALAAGVRGRDYHNRGRLLYWKGRLLEQQGRTKPAHATYREVVTSEPLSYYAQLAANRLRASGPGGLRGLLTEPGAPAPFRFEHRKVFDRAGFARGLALLRLGLGAEARREFDALGLLDGRSQEDLWLAAVLFERAGLPQRSHDIPRRRIAEFQDVAPVAGRSQYWRVAYPQPYLRELRAAVQAEGLPEALLYGIMREESGFNPTVVSYAQAIGLTQLLLKTAQHTARGLKGLKVSRAALMQPALNLRLGARYLAGLLRRLGHPALAVAGYNAGGSAAARWRKAWPQRSPDELVESIPYEQTRNYTKRVIEAFGRYEFLYGSGKERFLELPLEFP